MLENYIDRYGAMHYYMSNILFMILTLTSGRLINKGCNHQGVKTHGVGNCKYGSTVETGAEIPNAGSLKDGVRGRIHSVHIHIQVLLRGRDQDVDIRSTLPPLDNILHLQLTRSYLVLSTRRWMNMMKLWS